MIEIFIPGFGQLQIKHLVLDYNGTLSCDGRLLTGVSSLLDRLSVSLRIHILTADTFGSVRKAFAESSHTVSVLPAGNETEAKASYVRKLGRSSSVCIGNGRNDQLMLKEAILGIAVSQEEGTSLEALLSADIVIPDIGTALKLLLHPQRLIATLRC